MNTYRRTITTLSSGQIFVFGSNAQGFHGAGAAGTAMFGPGHSNNTWRTLNVPATNQRLDQVSNGTRGYWAVKGIAQGFQQGLYGWSYAIKTVTSPGARRSVSLDEINAQVKVLYTIAISRPDLTFFIAQGAKTGYNGYTPEELGAHCWFCQPVPENIVFDDFFIKHLLKCNIISI